MIKIQKKKKMIMIKGNTKINILIPILNNYNSISAQQKTYKFDPSLYKNCRHIDLQ